MNKIISLALLSSILLSTACSTTHSVAISGHSGSGKKVTAEASTFNFLHLNPMSLETSSKVISDLSAQCNNKGVSGVTTKTSSTFLYIGISEKVEASAYCN